MFTAFNGSSELLKELFQGLFKPQLLHFLLSGLS